MSEATGRVTACLASENITEDYETYGVVTVGATYDVKLPLDGTSPIEDATVTVERLTIEVEYRSSEDDPFGFTPPGMLPLTVDGARALWAALGHALAEVADDE